MKDPVKIAQKFCNAVATGKNWNLLQDKDTGELFVNYLDRLYNTEVYFSNGALDSYNSWKCIKGDDDRKFRADIRQNEPFKSAYEKAKKGTSKEPTKEAPKAPAQQKLDYNNPAELMKQAISLLQPNTSVDSSTIEAIVKTELEKAMKNIKPDVLEVKTIDNSVKIEGKQDPHFNEVLTYVHNNMPVYLYGPSGTGKSYMARNIAKALNLKFYFTNCVTQEFKLTGFVDANGKYQETAFYKAMKYGGLFFLDEMDGSDPSALVNLNSALADGYFQFPNEFVECHKDFRVIAAGNTAGQGADNQYTGRFQLDAASLNRFKKVQIGYDYEIELALARNDNDLVTFIHEIREKSQNAGIELVVTYRDIRDIASLKDVVGLRNILQSTVFYNTSKDSIQMLADELPDSEYTRALKRLAA